MEYKDGYILSIKGNDDRPDDKYIPGQLKKGIEIEFEHTSDENLAKSIAKDHLDEFDMYYDALIEMEDKLKRQNELIDKGITINELDSIIIDEMQENMSNTNNENVLSVVYQAPGTLSNDTLITLLASIGHLGNSGHSFDIILDPLDTNIKLFWDGDGSDRIHRIEKGYFSIIDENFKHYLENVGIINKEL